MIRRDLSNLFLPEHNGEEESSQTAAADKTGQQHREKNRDRNDISVSAQLH